MELDYTFERQIELTKQEYEAVGIQKGLLDGITLSLKRLLDQGYTKEQILSLGFTEDECDKTGLF